MTIACCKCKRTREGGEWKRSPKVDLAISHTYCPACLAAAMTERAPSAKGYRLPPIGPVPVFSNFSYREE